MLRYGGKCLSFILKFISNIVIDFGHETNILAVKFWADRGIHFIERLMWMFVVISLMSWACVMSKFQLVRYEKRSTVMAVERDFPHGISSFPALTICYDPEINETAFDEFIWQTWNISSSDSEYLYYNSFLNSVLHSRVQSYQFLATFADDDYVLDIDHFKVVKALQDDIFYIARTSNMNARAIMTEKGLCLLINSELFPKLTTNKFADKQNERQPYILEVQLKHGAGSINVHSTYEIPAFDSKVMQFKPFEDIRATFKVTETVASDELRKLSVSQRKCIFPDEGTSYSKIYSQSVCLARCRAQLALNLCECIPFFYADLLQQNCTTKHFECLKGFDWPTWSFSACHCPNACTEIDFVMQTMKRKTTSDENGSRFRLEIIPPKVRKRRSVVFGFEDLLVSFGGVWSLLLGFSLMTIVHLISVLAFHILNLLLK